MADPLFVAHAKLEQWIDDREVTFDDGILTLLSQKRSYRLAPAVFVKSLIDGEDAQRLVGRVLSLADLEALGAEHFQGTVILGDTGYQCEEGFVGDEVGGAPEALPATAAASSAPAVRTTADSSRASAAAQANAEQSDTDLLTKFLLEHL